MTDTAPSRKIVAAVADLMFGSRIRAAAEREGVHVSFARTSQQILEQAATADLVLLDLDARWLDAPEVIRALKSQGANAGVIAFGPHVDADSLTAARAAGADRVLARSAFVKLLPDLLRGVIETARPPR